MGLASVADFSARRRCTLAACSLYLLMTFTPHRADTLTITGFSVQDNQLFAAATVVGNVLNASGDYTFGLLESFLLPARIRKATPRLLRMEFVLPALELIGVRTDPGKVAVEINSTSADGLDRTNLLEAIFHRCTDPQVTCWQLADLLNQLLIQQP